MTERTVPQQARRRLLSKPFFAACLSICTAAACSPRHLEIDIPKGPPEAGADAPPAPPDTGPILVLPDAVARPDACIRIAREICNGLDDDCNGIVDDVVASDLQDKVTSCGRCDITCLPVPPNAESVCVAGVCGFTCKDPSFRDVNGSKEDGCECQFTGQELCDGKDNNCDGRIDEAFDLAKDANNCGKCGNKCTLPGADAGCEGGMCTLKMCLPGFADRNKIPGDGCESNCAETNGGVEICDGRDNDCDGKIDEINSEADRTTDDKLVYVQVADVTMFAYESARPDSTDKAPGSNGTVRACSLPSRMPWTNIDRKDAAKACEAVGTMWRLCSSIEWEKACSRGSVTVNPYPYGASYDGMKCNGVDFKMPPSVVATGSATMCASEAGAPPGETRIYDLSGNVREWVTTTAASAFEMRGGAYNIASFSGDAPGLKCTAAIPAPMAAVRLPSVGFRCCRTGKLPAQ